MSPPLNLPSFRTLTAPAALVSMLLGTSLHAQTQSGVSPPFNAGNTAYIQSNTQPGLLNWGDGVWSLTLDGATGALIGIKHRNDPHHMNWLRQAGRWERRDWKPDASPEARSLDGQWGLVDTAHTGLMHVAKVQRVSDRAWEVVSTSGVLTVTTRREFNPNGELHETYTLKNTGNIDLALPAGSVSITAPFFDQYPDTKESLSRRCHTHVWTGGSSSWVNAMRMGAEAPHLGLVLTAGSLDSYSQRGGTFNDRGIFLLHPGSMTLKPGQGATLSWKLFWHQGWDDFFQKAAAVSGFVRLTAKNYVVPIGRNLEVTAEAIGSLEGAEVFANGKPVEVRTEARRDGRRLCASIPTTAPGDLVVTLAKDGHESVLRAFVTPPVLDLIDARVKFIVRKQQRNTPGDPLDGAYLSYDNETGQQVYDPMWPDHNAGRERLAMGVLGAMYFPLCRDETFKSELQQSLRRYAAFISRELEDENGVVYEAPGRKVKHRLYNFIWAAHFHIAMYQALGDEEQLDRFVRVMRAFYASKEGSRFYPIGIPAYHGLKALEKAGRTADHDELLANFRDHADFFLKSGSNYPRSEVNFEQAIVGPAAQLLAEMHLITGEPRYLDGAREQMPLLENFAGRQPDSRLHEIAIRHWDDHWFGKHRVYGDTMPHYWSTINGLTYAYYGLGTKDASWLRRADAVVKGNLSLFTSEGTGSAAHLYARQTNGITGQRNDPWANDQDWALVNLLMTRDISKSAIQNDDH